MSESAWKSSRTSACSTARSSTSIAIVVRMPNGRDVTVDVIRHARSVVLLPIPEPGHVILIRQYRYPVNRWLWELPAGSVDEGEEPDAAARRECHEEIGQVPDTIVRLAALYPTPGYCDEEMIFYRLSGLSVPAEAARSTRTRTSSRERSGSPTRARWSGVARSST